MYTGSFYIVVIPTRYVDAVRGDIEVVEFTSKSVVMVMVGWAEPGSAIQAQMAFETDWVQLLQSS